MRTRRSRLFLSLLPLLLALFVPVAYAAEEPPSADEQARKNFAKQVREDTRWLSGFASRVVGSPGHSEASEKLLEKVKAVSGARVWTQKFPVVVPRTLEASLTVSAGPHEGAYDIYPFWPASARLNTTPKEGISGRLVYIGEGKPGRLPGHLPARSLRGQIAVMEITGGKRWIDAFNGGATAFLILGSPTATFKDGVHQLVGIPINVPRFYVPPGKLADALRNGEISEGRLYCRAQWVEVTAANIYALVKPLEPAEKLENRQALVIGVPYDSMSVVLDLAPGADVAVDAAFALNFLEYLAEHPPKRPVLFAFIDAYALNQIGTRQMFGSLAAVHEDRKDHLKDTREVAKTYREHEELAADADPKVAASAPGYEKALAKSLSRLHGRKYRDLRRYMKDEVAREVVRIETIMYPKRTALLRRTKLREKREDQIKALREQLKTATGDKAATLQAEIDKLQGEIRKTLGPDYKLGVDAEELKMRRALHYGAQRRLHTDAPVLDFRDFRLANGETLTKKTFDDFVKGIGPARRTLALCRRADDKLFTKKDLKDIESGARTLESFELANGGQLTNEALSEINSALKQLASLVYKDGRALADKDLDAIMSSQLTRELWAQARKRIAGQLEEVEHILATYAERDRFRVEMLEALDLSGETERPLSFVFGLDLSDAGVAVGPCFVDHFLHWNESKNAEFFTSWLKAARQKADNKLWPESLRRAVNLAPLTGMESVHADTVGRVCNPTSAARSFATGGVTWSTLEAARLRLDTPNDRFDRLDWGRLDPQVEATFFLLKRVVTDTGFLPATKEKAYWSRIRGTIVDQSPGEPVPRVPMTDYLTALVPGGLGTGEASVWFDPTPGVRRQEFAFTGIDGRFRFDLIPASGWPRNFVAQAYKVAEDGRLVRAVDLLKGGRGVSISANAGNTNPSQLRAVVFDCVEVTALGFFDPRFLLVLPGGSVMDASRGSRPLRMNYVRHGGMMTIQVKPDVRWQLILRHGITANRMALLNMVDTATPETAGLSMRDLMKGFEVDEPLPLHPLHIGARDFYRLDRKRLENYKQAGIASKEIEKIQRRTGAFLADIERAIEKDDGAAHLRAASGAMANEVRVYQAVRDTASDVIKGAIFLLLVLVPFSFVVERLLFASPSIYKQIGAILGVFGVMAAVLWSFHPAFRITGQPLMILMAFGAIGMSLMVMSMIFSKFESLLEEMRSGRAEASGARTSRMGLAYTAVRLGIANMRKRKLRTALTGITIVLITFALLCFTSAREYRGKNEASRDVAAPYAGVLVARTASRSMPEEALETLRNVAPEGWTVVPRYWWVSPYDSQWRVHVRNPRTGKRLSLKAALGLVGDEAKLTHLDKLCPNWERFDEGGGCYLSDEAAKRLEVKPGAEVILAGQSLELLGTYDARELDTEVRRLDGESIVPYDFTRFDDEQRRETSRSSLEELKAEMTRGVGLGPAKEMPRAPGDDIVIVHASLLRGLRDCSLKSIAVAGESDEEVQEFARELAERLAFPIYYGSPEGGVRVVRSMPLLPRAPKSLVIPLVIAGLIILNTMLSSIAERRREIYIYTSLGLAPLHVGFLFLAEAVTYGLMGSIFGYVVGQGVARFLSEMGLMGGITLNYSGIQAIFVMVMVLGVVIVSSLVPAFLAGKLATPSNEMTWKVPQPVDDVIRDKLPFTATGRTAGGVLEFLYEYMDAHREGSVGTFSTDNLEKFHREADGMETLGVRGTVWLAPYDLGVRQDLEITIRGSAETDIYEIDIKLRRRSGQESSWWKLNRVLLSDLRRQLLGWRKLKIDRMLEYILRAAEAGQPLETMSG